MRRLPLADELPYHFYPPRLRAFWAWLGWPYIRHLIRGELKVAAIDVAGIEHLRPLLGSGDGILLAPNHCDHADCGVIFDLSRRLGRPFCYMAAHQIFTGMNRWFLPRLGVFPVDREGSDLRAFKAGVEVLAEGRNPLVVFPEGEIYHMADRLTPLREGAAALAIAAAKRVAGAGRKVWVVPAAIKYRFPEGHDPCPALEARMSELETRFTWFPRDDRDLVRRIYDYAEAMLTLKELEYFGATRTGPLAGRIAALSASILDRLEDKHFGKRSSAPAPVRVKALRHSCLEKLAAPETTTAEARAIRGDLNDAFVVIQAFSYPGDYLRSGPTVERAAEILTLFEQDIRGADMALPVATRRAHLRVGVPLDVSALLAAGGRSRAVGATLTHSLEGAIQGLLDSIPPGRPLAVGPPIACGEGVGQSAIPSSGM